jgi:hypothetical protein
MIEGLAQHRAADLGARQTTHVVAIAVLQETAHVRPIRLHAQ